MEPKSDTVTDGVRISVRAQLRPDHSWPLSNEFRYDYLVTVANESCSEPVQLVSRFWEILDFDGDVAKVRTVSFFRVSLTISSDSDSIQDPIDETNRQACQPSCG